MSAIRLIPFLIFSVMTGTSARAANLCTGNELQGPYGFQLSGVNTISGKAAPAVGLARLDFDGERNVSGYSSVNFTGLLLGNPVTGSYAVGRDCSVSWSLQDDSGAFQHFRGVITPDGARVTFHQTDPGTGGSGTMERTSDTCTAADFRGSYTFATSAGARRVLEADGAGNFKGNGTFEVDSDCVVRFELELDGRPTKWRGVLVRGGQEVLAIETDPGAPVAARLTAVSPAGTRPLPGSRPRGR